MAVAAAIATSARTDAGFDPGSNVGGAGVTNRSAIGLLALALTAFPGTPATADTTAEERGEYLLRAAGCVSCHTTSDGDFLGGGTAIESPFGTFYGPNITPHPEHGIGRWGEQDFIRALREGVGPGGRHYYPAFPYPSYTRLREQDMRALWAYLRSVPASSQPNRDHDLPWWLRWRLANLAWKWLFVSPGEFQEDPERSEQWNRGAYLVNAASHCGECHTPRDYFGSPIADLHLAGTRDGPDGGSIPNITPDEDTGIGRWRASQIVRYLRTGLAPGGDIAGGLMAEAIDDGLRYLRDEDLKAIAEYLLSLPPVRNPAQSPAGSSEPRDDPFG